MTVECYESHPDFVGSHCVTKSHGRPEPAPDRVPAGDGYHKEAKELPIRIPQDQSARTLGEEKLS